MLSSAHILAMDAKNLLDVIDSIRINYPNVDQMITATRASQSTASPSPARTRSSVSTSSGSASASSSAASSLEKHRDHREPGLSPLHSSRGSPLVPRPSIT